MLEKIGKARLSYTVMNEREELIRLIRQRSFQYSETPVFRLTSGLLSNFYFNLKKTTLSPTGSYCIGKLVYDAIAKEGWETDAVGGLTLGADPIAVAVSRHSYGTGHPVEAFVLRKEPKGHGMGLQAEGYVKPGDRVVIIDDVVTTGGSTIKAIGIARECGFVIQGVVVLLDRCEQNGRQNIETLGYPVRAILSLLDFMPPSGQGYRA